MLEKLYSKYFQKSRSFLYPALGIKKRMGFHPISVYISLEGKYGPEDMKLICTYEKKDNEAFKNFESQMLLGNPLFNEKIETKNHYVYVFDYEIYKNDWFSFLLGKYSRLSSMLKKAIKEYYGENTGEYKYMDSYLNPDKYYDEYSELLGVSVSTLKSIGELCDPCDLDKETLKMSELDLEVVNNIS